jgi:uncharacterized protein Yka (UPF0111/DUF47 family)
MARVSRGGHWFLPETPDVVGLLRRQLEVTINGLEAMCRWSTGDPAAADELEAAEDRGDTAKRELMSALRAAFVTPLEPEDVFSLSRGIDWILNHSGDLVKEARVLHATPDEGLAEMAQELLDAVRHIDRAVSSITDDEDAAMAAAYEAIGTERRLERSYYQGMATLLEVEEMRERISRRELYRRCSRIGETVVEVSERIVYAVVKET